MSANVMKAVLAKHSVGEIFWVTNDDLALSAELFNVTAREWDRVGGGDGFRVVEAKRESETSEMKYEALQVHRIS